MTEMGTSHKEASSKGVRLRVPHPEGEPEAVSRTVASSWVEGKSPHWET